MEPTLYDGDRLLIRYGAPPRPGTVAIVRVPDRPVAVKRLMSRLDDGWWVSRDNPTMGADSGQFGTIPDEDVLARVLVRVWPVWRARSSRAGREGGGAAG